MNVNFIQIRDYILFEYYVCHFDFKTTEQITIQHLI